MISRDALMIILPGALIITGCGKPNQANIVLRKEDQKQQAQIARLQHQLAADQTMIAGLQNRNPHIPSLPPEELDKLFTVHAIKFGRLTGPYTPDGSNMAAGLKIYIMPVDQSDQALKAAGSFEIEAFDLSAPQSRIGRWSFNLEEAKKYWYGYFLLDYYYVLPCPWQAVPRHADLTVRVTFVDELTKIPFAAQREVKVNLPLPTPSTQPGSS
jgi:hypothetical protein